VTGIKSGKKPGFSDHNGFFQWTLHLIAKKEDRHEQRNKIKTTDSRQRETDESGAGEDANAIFAPVYETAGG
jgi:hypothetical protein